MESLILTTDKKLADVIYDVMNRIEEERKEKSLPVTVTINQAAKKINRSHVTVSRMVKKGLIKTTPDGRIIESELDKFFI
jgi:IS30 family transposase